MLDPALVGGERGHVMVQLADMTGSETGMIPGIPAIFKNKTIGELDWDGNVVMAMRRDRAGACGTAASRLGPPSQRRHLGPVCPELPDPRLRTAEATGGPVGLSHTRADRGLSRPT